MNRNLTLYTIFFVAIVALAFSACKDKRSTGLEYAPNMYNAIALNPDQPVSTTDPYLKSFGGHAPQVPPAHTKPIGFKVYDEYPNDQAGYEAAGAQMVNPLPADSVTLAEGQHLFTVFCSPCHGDKGDGQGHLVKIEKFNGVPSYYEGNSSRGGAMADLTAGKIYHTITYGLNNMGSHASQISPTDRWKVVEWVQHLQQAKGQ